MDERLMRLKFMLYQLLHQPKAIYPANGDSTKVSSIHRRHFPSGCLPGRRYIRLIDYFNSREKTCGAFTCRHLLVTTPLRSMTHVSDSHIQAHLICCRFEYGQIQAFCHVCFHLVDTRGKSKYSYLWIKGRIPIQQGDRLFPSRCECSRLCCWMWPTWYMSGF